MNIGEQRRTWFVEPIEELPDDPVRKPDREQEPVPQSPSGRRNRHRDDDPDGGPWAMIPTFLGRPRRPTSSSLSSAIAPGDPRSAMQGRTCSLCTFP